MTAAYGQMSLNDYLLTTATLCQVHVEITMVNVRDDLATLKFNRYTRNIRKLGHGDSIADLSIDGSKVAAWVSTNYYKVGWHSRRLEVLPDAERIIFAALGLSESHFKEFVA